MQSNGEQVENQTALNTMMAEVPKNLKKIAGKSLPIEVSRSFLSSHGDSDDLLPSEIRISESEKVCGSEPQTDTPSDRVVILFRNRE